MESVAAERVWFAVAPDGTEHQVTLQVGIPAQASDGVWWSAVSLLPLESRERRIAGIDGWQAVNLAMSYVAARVDHFAAHGWQFFWSPDGEPATPTELLGRKAP
jgi:hypothetical protein